MIFLIIVTILIGYLFHELYLKRRNLPPGPTPYPLLGNVPMLAKYEPGYEAFITWKKKYGPVFTFWLGSHPFIILADYPTIKKSIIQDGDKYTGRFLMPTFQMYRGGDYGVVETTGDVWREQRRFTLHTLRDFGLGRNLMEERVQVEVGYLLDRLGSGYEVSVQQEMDIAVGSVSNNILFGYRFDDDKLDEFQRLNGLLKAQMKEFSSPLGALIMIFPWFRYLPVFNAYWNRLFFIRDNIFGFLRHQIQKKKEIVDFDSNESSDFAECFIKEQHKRRDEPNFGGYSEKQFENLVFDLWVAGMETTSNTMTWGITYILNDDEIQKRLHDELDQVVHGDRLVTLADRNNLPYLNATICEIQRLANLLPQNLTRQCTEDVVINGYALSKGTTIVPQICCVLYDEKTFPEPYVFRPERFLNEDGNLKKCEELIPFSIGKRQCVGEGLAKVELFLFLANILHRFNIVADVKPSTRKTFGITVQALPYKCRFEKRF